MKYYINIAIIQQAIFYKIGEVKPPWKIQPLLSASDTV